jgi:hypothetical protein
MGHIYWNEYYKLITSGENVDVLAIGDSWFHYPHNNLISPLYTVLEQPTIYVIGENGARADELCTGSWLTMFKKMLVDYPGLKLVCISAGGNDFAGIGDLDGKILRPDCTGAATANECFRTNQPKGVFDDVQAAYRALLDAVGATRPGLPVLVHNYDYAIPDGRTLPGMSSWLKLPMDNGQVPTARAPLGGIRRDIVRALIDEFTIELSALETTYPGGTKAKADLIWSAGTLTDTEWANELHPKSPAFSRLVRDCWSGPARKALGLP